MYCNYIKLTNPISMVLINSYICITAIINPLWSSTKTNITYFLIYLILFLVLKKLEREEERSRTRVLMSICIPNTWCSPILKSSTFILLKYNIYMYTHTHVNIISTFRKSRNKSEKKEVYFLWYLISR